MFNLVKGITSLISGNLSDRFSKRVIIIVGWLIYAFVYFGFGLSTGAPQMLVLFLIYGIYFGFTEGVERAFISEIVRDENRRGTAYGLYNFAIGVTSLPSSVVFGLIWESFSPLHAFFFGGSLALICAVGLLFLERL